MYRFTYPGSEMGYVAIERDGKDVFDAVLYDGDQADDTVQPLLDLANRVETTITRLKADLVYHQEAAAEITRDELDIDTAPEGAYSIEADCAESYHTGRVEALTNAIDLLLGRELALYSETQEASA